MIKKSKFWMVSVCCLIALVSLTGCNGSNPLSPAPKGPVPISEALKEDRLWIQVRGYQSNLYKDMDVDSVWQFHDDGNVTVYLAPHAISLKDFKGLSNEEIVTLVKDEYVKATKLSGEYNPSPQPYELIVKTDGSGNRTDHEVLETNALQIKESNSTSSLAMKRESNVLLTPVSQAIYDTRYCGLGWSDEVDVPNLINAGKTRQTMGCFFITACDEGFPGFILDTPTTEGVKVE